ncbi:Pkinase-domain-containing protein [Patellaria atrata CBS 101060]|uniref:Pkinase-domain-containing protein n=1 Tax=Patellaria atrata CBS 101060 TaxID=1346257 RepID=A0A9P4SIK6_9PEZI|nr:Pkinase-domain-containing protein [Patellaria atrata CBS 101060]
MPPTAEKSSLKRGHPSLGEPGDSKKVRRSDRARNGANGDEPNYKANLKDSVLPSPVTNRGSTATEDNVKIGSSTPPNINHAFASPPEPSDTQPYSQFVYPPNPHPFGEVDEDAEGIWGYLISLDSKAESLILRRRGACPVPEDTSIPTDSGANLSSKKYIKEEENFEMKKAQGVTAGGFLLGRHPECDRVLNDPTVSNRHCLLFYENKGGDMVAIVEDLSANGTFVNEALIGRNKRRELANGDELSIVSYARFLFKYPHNRDRSRFRQQYSIQEQLGKGHFASVYLCVEKNSGIRYAVKKFEKRTGPNEKSKVDGLQQEIGVLMGVSHPSLLCLKDTFDEEDGVYLVLELAPEGELFNWIVMKQKLTEAETRKIFIQLFQAVKYLHDRNIVHRDIKPENILLIDRDLHVKLADFGLAKIIGEESFTTTLCGTPSYVAPEILENSNHRRYTRAVDIWSLGVVLYICLCGFPPFSDELYSAENPYTLSQQIKQGRFDYPSPYWDSVGDPALDLIDRMLTVNVEARITVDECLEHPWMTQRELKVNDSTDGLTGAMSHLDFSKRKMHRERTLLCSINEIRVDRVIEMQGDHPPLKIYEKNKTGVKNGQGTKEEDPAANRDPDEFIKQGGRGDQVLFDNEDSRYTPPNSATASQLKVEQQPR